MAAINLTRDCLQKFQHSRAFGSSPFGLPVVVAWADLLVTISSRWHTQAFGTTFIAEEQTRLLVVCFGASLLATWTAICYFNMHHLYLNIKFYQCKKSTKNSNKHLSLVCPLTNLYLVMVRAIQ